MNYRKIEKNYARLILPAAIRVPWQAAGVELAYLCEWELPDGKHRIVTIPVG